ncbi:MAG: ATP-dependent DNA helicase RecQ [Thermoleophilia bacterium]|nr:ATP-dependent DNA helicase RecQ [Thermoleophilia bacterium]
MSSALSPTQHSGEAIAGEEIPLGVLSELVRWVEASERAGAESPAAHAAVEARLAVLREAWPSLAPADRGLLGALVTGLVARRPGAGDAVAAPAGDTLADALARLGVRRLRPGQDRAIAAGLCGRDALVVMATGSGKSLCYQAPAAVLDGLTVVVSPLIALMTDQLAGLVRAGIPAAALHSGLSDDEQRLALARARQGELSLLYVAPERFHSSVFRRAMAEARVGLLVIDEAHCVSEWGHEFRPDYRRVGQFRQELRPRATMALTATATERVRADIVKRLGLASPLEITGGFDRPNLTFDAIWVEGKGSVARKRQALLAAVKGAGGGKTIVYCGTRRAAEETAGAVAAAGYSSVVYHAGRSDRADAQDAFSSGRAQVVAATNAFGMGVNVPDVRLVVHTALPDSLEQLYQEAGRAGRDGEPSRHVIVAGPADEVAIRRRITAARIDTAEVEQLLGRLSARADENGDFQLDRREVDDETGFRLAMAERVGALQVEGAPGGGRRGRLAVSRLSPDQREDLAGQVQAELRRRYRALDQAVAYVRSDDCRRRAFLTHFDDDAEPAPEERCCNACAVPDDLAAVMAGPVVESARAAAQSEPAEALDVGQRRVYEALRAWRGEVAKELGWPAFRVASNRTLAAIAQAAPRDEDDLARVRGVGPWLMETHAPRILRILSETEDPA